MTHDPGWDNTKDLVTAHDRFCRLLDHMTYKTGWELRIDRMGHNLVQPFRLNIKLWVENTYEPHDMVTIDSYHPLPPRTLLGWKPTPENDAEFYQWVREQIHWRELHESDEWFKINGVMVWDPHRTDPRLANSTVVRSEVVTQGFLMGAVARTDG